jgi:hypothetical protein
MVEYGELSFKVVRLEPGGQEVIARAGNYEICKAAFDKALFVYRNQRGWHCSWPLRKKR